MIRDYVITFVPPGYSKDSPAVIYKSRDRRSLIAE